MNPFVKLPLAPPGFVTVTVTGPEPCVGVVAVIVVLLTTTTSVAAAPPNVTVASAANPVPVIVTAVPPAVEPLFGVTPLVVTGPAATIVSVSVAFPVPPLLVALSVTIAVPVAVGVPVINPVVVFRFDHAGRPVAP